MMMWGLVSISWVGVRLETNIGGVLRATYCYAFQLRFPYRLIVIRLLNGQTESGSRLLTNRVLFATNVPDGISSMQPKLQP